MNKRTQIIIFFIGQLNWREDKRIHHIEGLNPCLPSLHFTIEAFTILLADRDGSFWTNIIDRPS